MGLFDKLFSKKEKPAQDKTEERAAFDSPHGRFTFVAYPGAKEYGYEGYVDWYPNGIEEETTEVYIDADTMDTTEAGICYARFERLIADRERVDQEIKGRAAEYFIKYKPDLLRGEPVVEDVTGDMEIFWIGFYREGSTEFLIFAPGIDADAITVILNADGSREIKYVTGEGDEYKDIREQI